MKICSFKVCFNNITCKKTDTHCKQDRVPTPSITVLIRGTGTEFCTCLHKQVSFGSHRAFLPPSIPRHEIRFCVVALNTNNTSLKTFGSVEKYRTITILIVFCQSVGSTWTESCKTGQVVGRNWKRNLFSIKLLG
jgi:hypothetical protein